LQNLKRAANNTSTISTVLSILLFLFFLRVLGQILVAFFHVSFLPPMEQWYSGLLPYPFLLVCQFAIIFLFAKVCFDIKKNCGYFARRKPAQGTFLIRFSVIYYSAMVVRYIVHMNIHPHDRWLGGTIPIVFHFVLATFLLLLGRYNKKEVRSSDL